MLNEGVISDREPLSGHVPTASNKQEIIKTLNYPFDFIRVSAMFGVILYHCAAAYSQLAPYWQVHDAQNLIGDALRELLDVFIMPFFLFIAGYFALPSLRNRSLSAFTMSKFNRLGVYWLFIVLVILPFMFWKADHLSGNYLQYWLSSLLNIKNISIGPMAVGKYHHMHFWFISLLLYIFVLVGVFYKLASKRFIHSNVGKRKIYKEISISGLLWVGILNTAFSFIVFLSYPGSSWLIAPMVLQFKVAQLPDLLLYFGFGVFIKSREWFSQNGVPFNLGIWVITAILLTMLFFVVGEQFFIYIDISNTLSPAYLFAFSLIRSFLLLTYLMLCLTLSAKYFNKKNIFIKKVSDVSYEIYLVHIFIVLIFQAILLNVAAIPVVIKIVVVFIAASCISYFFARYTLYKFPKTSAGVIFFLLFVLMAVFNR